jgi:hypothetical protein
MEMWDVVFGVECFRGGFTNLSTLHSFHVGYFDFMLSCRNQQMSYPQIT